LKIKEKKDKGEKATPMSNIPPIPINLRDPPLDKEHNRII
jgi:hypothetical protein